jgi:hypothetical protein
MTSEQVHVRTIIYLKNESSGNLKHISQNLDFTILHAKHLQIILKLKYVKKSYHDQLSTPTLKLK